MEPESITCVDAFCGSAKSRSARRETPSKDSHHNDAKLSWPSTGGRRSIVTEPENTLSAASGDTGTAGKVTGATTQSHIVQVSAQDLARYYQLARSTADTGVTSQPNLEVYMTWNPSRSLEIGAEDLVHYFHSTASKSLLTLSHDPAALGAVLLRICFSGNTDYHKAALLALLAFSSLHQHKVYIQSVELKIAAIKAMTAAHTTDLPMPIEVVKLHVVVGMLLCCLEVQQASCTTGQWTYHLHAVRHMTTAAELEKFKQQDSEIELLLDWVSYHAALAQFSGNYWRRHQHHTDLDLRTSPEAALATYNSVVAAPKPNPIQLLAELFEAAALVSGRRDSKGSCIDADGLSNLQQFLQVMNWRIGSMSGPIYYHKDPHLMLQALRCAMTIYLGQSFKNIVKRPASLKPLHIEIAEAFKVLSAMSCCCWQFPLFIIGCEARTDAERTIVLDLIARTELNESSRSLRYTRTLVQAIWTLDDLATQPLDYQGKLASVITGCVNMPSFV